jgi:NADPH:quinone reductase-like Zn-dependent oxidoreductase
VTALGADEAIDYTRQDFAKVLKDCDCVFDTVGGDVTQRSFAVLKPGGRAAFIASGNTAPEPERKDVTSLRPAVGRDRAHLERICDLYAAGAVTVPPVTLFALSDAARAHAVSEGRHLRGKLVFKVR